MDAKRNTDTPLPPMSFFSFHLSESQLRPQTTADAVDDFVAAHISSDTQIRPQQQQQQQQQQNKHKQKQSQSQIQMQSQRATLRAAKSAPARTNGGRADQVHPLIRGQRLETPEEIAQWIAERKRRYPTDANIRRKLAEEQGIAESEAKRRCLAPDAAGTNPLSTMLGAYGQSSDSDCNSDGSDGDSEDSDSPPETVPLKHYAPQTPHRPATMAPGGDRRALRVCRFYAKGSCTKGAACPFSHPQQGARQAPATAGPPPAPKHSSLLHMLLAKDIERENHRVLQCIQYICSNAFLGTQPRYD